MGLAAETAADLGSGGAQPRNIHAEKLCRDIADHEVALGAHPNFTAPVGTDARQTGMRLDIALMRRFGLVGALDHDIGLAEARLDIAVTELAPASDVRGRGRLRLDA